jgi:hypothetical protein
VPLGSPVRVMWVRVAGRETVRDEVEAPGLRRERGVNSGGDLLARRAAGISPRFSPLLNWAAVPVSLTPILPVSATLNATPAIRSNDM